MANNKLLIKTFSLICAFLCHLRTVPCSRAQDAPGYARDVAPFIDEYCLACHDEGVATSELDLHSVEAMLRGGRRGPAVVPGESAGSALIQYLKGQRQPQMPPRTSVPLDRIAVLERWIDAGARADAAEVAEVDARREEAREAEEREAATAAGDANPPVTSLAYAPDGKALAVAGYREVLVADPSDGSTVRRLAGFPDQVTAVAFSPDGAHLAGAGGAPGRQGEVRIWETAGWREVGVVRGHSDTVLALAWRPGSSQLATASLDRLIHVWDWPSGAIVRTIKGHADVVHALAYSPDGARLASGSADRTAKLHDAETGLQVASLSTHNDAVLQVAFSPDGARLATASADRGIALWKLDNLNNPERGFGHTGPVYALAWRPDSTSLWAGSGGRPSMLSFVREDGNRAVNIDESTLPKDWVYAVAVAPGGASVAVGGWEGTVTIYGLGDGKVARTFVPGED